MTENQIQKEVFDHLVLHNFLVIRVNGGRKGHVAFARWQALGHQPQTRGVSDILALSPSGRLYAIEVKTPDTAADTSQSQSVFLQEARQRGAIALVVSSLADLTHMS